MRYIEIPTFPILEDQYGEHPLLNNEDEFNAYVLANLGGATNKIQVIHSDGSRDYFTNWQEAHTNAVNGDTVIFGSGNYGDSQTNVVIQKSLNIVLQSNTNWIFNYLYLHTASQSGTRFITIVGNGGTLTGKIQQYGEIVLDVRLIGVKHYGLFAHEGFPYLFLSNTLLLEGCECHFNPFGSTYTAYITANTSAQNGAYLKGFNAEIRNTIIYSPILHKTDNNNAPTTNNTLTIRHSTLVGESNTNLFTGTLANVNYVFHSVDYIGLADNVTTSIVYKTLPPCECDDNNTPTPIETITIVDVQGDDTVSINNVSAE